MSQSSVSIVIKLDFAAAHRISGHQGKCKYLHGHHYEVEVKIAADSLDDLGFVIDFGIIKSHLKLWINEHLDHTCILAIEDKALGDYLSSYTGQKVYYLSLSDNKKPTAENIALHLYGVFNSIISRSNESYLQVQNKQNHEPFLNDVKSDLDLSTMLTKKDNNPKLVYVRVSESPSSSAIASCL